ncbi:hypothetical protein GCM10025868_42220 [Angustibacter aerolatus]|uniref:Major facilitator superfamily (MFS) profile domain-containing protein n=1 Tax=Angustibacter aerolatus TaxID=1162965 RepID=A0ABQ6JMF5_9ACTN|nr:hypothetical protein GCM10025868_42220 [Angustibacter aerolatus]
MGALGRLLGITGPVGAGTSGAPWVLGLPGVGALPDLLGSASLSGAAHLVPSLLLALGPQTPDRVGSRAPLEPGRLAPR